TRRVVRACLRCVQVVVGVHLRRWPTERFTMLYKPQSLPWHGPRWSLRHSWSSDRGTSMVEMAIIIPVFLMLILGAVDLGQAVVMRNGVSEAARDGARAAIVLATPVQATPSSGTVPTPTPYATLSSAAQQTVA